MKKVVSILLVIALCVSLCACTSKKTDERSFKVTVTNKVPDTFKTLTVILWEDSSKITSQDIIAQKVEFVGEEVMELVATDEDITSEYLENIRLQAYGTDKDGNTIETGTVQLYPVYGDELSFELVEEDGNYSLWMVV